jgi:hypothetical protein
LTDAAATSAIRTLWGNDMALYVRIFTRRKRVNFSSSKQTNSGKEAPSRGI